MPLAPVAQPETTFYYRVPQVAAILNVHRSTVYRAIDSGALTAVRLGQRGGLRVPAAALDAYLTASEIRPALAGVA
jgi:excisionase family DNA binding protein